MCNHKPIAIPDPEAIAYYMREAAKEYNGGQPIPYYPTDTAPDDWHGLKFWGDQNEPGVDQIPVFSGGCDKTIYPSPDDNHCFRAWHDVIHLKENLGFSERDEISVSDLHCSVLRYVGAPYDVVKAVEADTKGQVLYYYKTGQFVEDQRLFVTECLAFGIKSVMAGVDHGARY